MEVASEARSEDFGGAPAGPVIKEKKVVYYQTPPAGAEPSIIEQATQATKEAVPSIAGLSPSKSSSSDVIAGLTHFQVITILGAIFAWWLLTQHYFLAAFGGTVLFLATEFPRQSSLILLAVGVPILGIWLLRHAFLALFLAVTSSTLYFFSDEEAKVRMNVAARRFWHSMSRVLTAAQHNAALLGQQAKTAVVEKVDRASSAASAAAATS